jgi:predicted site-specific integrase-resolvase
MSEMLNLREAFIALKMYNITHSEQVLRRWLREGKIKGIRPENRKEGWLIDHDDLERFIQRRQLTVERLVAKLQDLISFLDKLSNQRKNSEDRLEKGIEWGYKQAKEIIERQFAFLLPKPIGGSEVGGLK